MKKLIGIIIAIITLFALTVPAIADEGSFIKIQNGFTLDPNQPGQLIEQGAIIHHLANGLTEVYGADKLLKFKARESEASMITTPNGVRSANRIYHLPNGSKIVPMGNTTQIFDINETLILTIIDDNSAKYVIQDDPTNGWVAHTYRDVSQITKFSAYWSVPSRPPSDTCVDFYFNAITKSGTETILQPVLQWNQVGNHKWQIQSWGVWSGGSATGAAYDVTQGSTIRGLMQITNPYNGTWLINTYCNGVLRSSLSIAITSIYVLRITCTLEAVPNGIWNNNVLPGGTHFYNMTFTSPDTILWTPVIDNHGVLDLSITYTNPTPVYIITN